MKRVARILSIDGGGIRGIIPATILANWETMLGPVSDRFHMVSGTSTGGIIGCGLTQPKPVSAASLAKFYIDNGPAIFNSPLSSLGGLEGAKYDATSLEKTIQKVISGNLSETVADLIVPSYEIEKRAPFLFKSWKAKNIDGNESDDNFRLCDVSRATSAAPTYFSPARIKNATAGTVSPIEYSLIDGGVYANNPAMCAYVAARRLYPNADEYFIVSLGTGATIKPFPYDDAINWGLAGWLNPLLEIMFDGVSSTVDYELSQLSPQVTHFRLQSDLSRVSETLDDVSAKNLQGLVAVAGETRTKYATEIATILARLKEPMSSRADLGYPSPGQVTKKPVAPVNATVAKVSSIVAKPAAAVGLTVPVAAGIAGATTGGLVAGPIGAAIGGFLGFFGLRKD